MAKTKEELLNEFDRRMDDKAVLHLGSQIRPFLEALIDLRKPCREKILLYDALRDLVDIYWANRGTPLEFIICKTLEGGIPDYWMKARDALEEFEKREGE